MNFSGDKKVWATLLLLMSIGFMACENHETSSNPPEILVEDESGDDGFLEVIKDSEENPFFLSFPQLNPYEYDLYGDNVLMNTANVASRSSSSRKMVSSSSYAGSVLWPPQNISAGSIYDEKANTLTDLRDSQVYKTIHVVGEEAHYDRVWMAENLNYAYLQQTGEMDSSSFCYDNDSANCETYGRLYLFSAAADSAAIFSKTGKGCGYQSFCFAEGVVNRGVCPSGWHLPDTLEMVRLLMADSRADRFKNGFAFYEDGALADFSPLPAGLSYNQTYSKLGDYVIFWAWGEYNSSSAFGYRLDHDTHDGLFAVAVKNYAHSLRCVKNVDPDIPFRKDTWFNLNPNVIYGSFVDNRDGQEYKSIDIWSEDAGIYVSWMAENLMFDYKGAVSGKPTKLSNDSSYARYGMQYTVEEALDGENLYGTAEGDTVRGICPEGWHLPMYSEFKSLIDISGGEGMAGYSLNSSKGWIKELRGSNLSGFSAVPRSYLGEYSGIWSSSKINGLSYFVEFFSGSTTSKQFSVRIAVDQGYNYRTNFVRCVKNREYK